RGSVPASPPDSASPALPSTSPSPQDPPAAPPAPDTSSIPALLHAARTVAPLPSSSPAPLAQRRYSVSSASQPLEKFSTHRLEVIRARERTGQVRTHTAGRGSAQPALNL